MSLILLALLLAQTGVVEGEVVNALTKAPVAGAAVRLHHGELSPRKTSSNAAGEFRFEDLAEGLYRIQVLHDDYVDAPNQEAGRVFAIVKTATKPVRWRSELMPRGGVAGRVLSPLGEPMKGIPLCLHRIWDMSCGFITTSGGDGAFRIPGVEPGSWLLSANPSFQILHSDPEKSVHPAEPPADEEGQRMAWVATFYPSAMEAAAASQIVIRPGAMAEGFTIKLRTAPRRRIAGVVKDEAGRPAKAWVFLSYRTRPGTIGLFQETSEEGRFEFDSVLDGEWLLSAKVQRDGPGLRDFRPIHVRGRDVAEVEARVQAPFALAGKVELEGAKELGQPALTLVPEDGVEAEPGQAKMATDGSFVFGTVYAARFRLRVTGLKPGQYVASVRYGETDVTAMAFAVAHPPLELRVAVRAGAAQVRGTVERCEGGSVVLVPEDEALRDLVAHGQVRRCDANGRFAMEGLRPGGYLAFAFEQVRDVMLENREFVRRLAPRAQRVELKHGETTSLELRRQEWPEH